MMAHSSLLMNNLISNIKIITSIKQKYIDIKTKILI